MTHNPKALKPLGMFNYLKRTISEPTNLDAQVTRIAQEELSLQLSAGMQIEGPAIGYYQLLCNNYRPLCLQTARELQMICAMHKQQRKQQGDK